MTYYEIPKVCFTSGASNIHPHRIDERCRAGLQARSDLQTSFMHYFQRTRLTWYSTLYSACPAPGLCVVCSALASVHGSHLELSSGNVLHEVPMPGWPYDLIHACRASYGTVWTSPRASTRGWCSRVLYAACCPSLVPSVTASVPSPALHAACTTLWPWSRACTTHGVQG